MRLIACLLLAGGASACAGRGPALPPGHPADPAAPSARAISGPDPFALSVAPAPLDLSDPTTAAIVRAHSAVGKSAQETHYECPMHPEVRQAAVGICPDCKMELVIMPGKLEEGARP